MREHHANQGRPDDRTNDDLGNRIDPMRGRSRTIPHLMSGHRDGISPMEIEDEDLRALSIDQFLVLSRTASSCKPRLNSPVPEGTAATPVHGDGPMPDRDRGDDGVPAESPAAWRHALGPPDGGGRGLLGASDGRGASKIFRGVCRGIGRLKSPLHAPTPSYRSADPSSAITR
jgi:hypothetical protein